MNAPAAPEALVVGGVPVFLREQVRPGDPAVVRRIAESSGFFSAGEIGVAVELVEARLSQGEMSGYHFLFADDDAAAGQSLGYSCYGPVPCTQSSYDLYWIAVHEGCRRIGLGTVLLRATEALIRLRGGSRVYVETSTRSLYAPTRSFYRRRGYRREAVIRDFYAPGDGKAIFVKELT